MFLKKKKIINEISRRLQIWQNLKIWSFNQKKIVKKISKLETMLWERVKKKYGIIRKIYNKQKIKKTVAMRLGKKKIKREIIIFMLIYLFYLFYLFYVLFVNNNYKIINFKVFWYVC